jgi:gluconolactonase
MDATYPVSGQAANMLFMPSNMVHSATLGPHGADQLDVFWPVRPDYIERAQTLQAAYEAIIAPGTKPVRLADGFTFTEGPTWLKGHLYFGHVLCHPPRATGPAACQEPPDRMTPTASGACCAGMQSNGTLAATNGRLLVCDMFGHRVVEVDPATGRVVRVVLDTVNGKPIDGPNDLVMDAKGGLYITDPQFTRIDQEPAGQAGVLRGAGRNRRVVRSRRDAMPNGGRLRRTARRSREQHRAN